MQVFVVINISQPSEVGAAIARHFANNSLSLTDGQWIVAGDLLTSRDVCDRLGISEGQNGNAIVVAMENYWGRAPSSIWEWVNTRKAAPHG